MSTFPSKSTNNSRTVFEGRVLEVTGLPTVYVIPSVETVQIPADNDGANPNYSNNQSFLYVYKGGVLQTGWAIGASSTSNCGYSWGIELTHLYIRVTSVTANTGYVLLTLTKAGESPLIVRVNFVKALAGVQGIQGVQGNQGNQGTQGITGATGSDGTGMVIVRYDIEVEQPTTPTLTDNGGIFRMEFSAVHNLSIGDRLHVFDSVYSEYGTVTNVISTTIVDTDITYISGPYDVRDMKHFARDDNYGIYNGDAAQNVEFPLIFPVNTKRMEMHFIKITGANAPLTLNAGNVLYSTTGWNSFINNKTVADIDDIESKNLYIFDDPFIVQSTDPNRAIYLRGQPSGTTWETSLNDNIYHLHISYINYN